MNHVDMLMMADLALDRGQDVLAHAVRERARPPLQGAFLWRATMVSLTAESRHVTNRMSVGHTKYLTWSRSFVSRSRFMSMTHARYRSKTRGDSFSFSRSAHLILVM